MLALFVLVDQHHRADEAGKRRRERFYLKNRRRVNNWDLVDASASHIVGPAVAAGRPGLLDRLARSASLWDRRIAMVGTQYFTRRGDIGPAFRLARALLDDPEPLLHKATGWMLRAAGDLDPERLRAFLRRYASTMPRTTLRYAIEHLARGERARWMRA